MTFDLPHPSLLPAAPSVPEDRTGRGRLALRYEDVVQDGRVQLRTMTHAIGAALWREVLARHPLAQSLERDRILPILNRIAVEGGGGPVSVRALVDCEACFDLARTIDERGELRLRLDMWATLTGPRSRTHGAPPSESSTPIPLGRVYAEHVLTRPFAPPAERKVAALPADAPPTALRELPWAPPHALASLPADATAIDDAWAFDAAPIVLGLGHTDSNQHVNSLVYPLLAEEAALRRLADLGLPLDRYLRFVDVAFRKPCFAGDRVRVLVRAFRASEDLGVLAAFVPATHTEPDPGDRAYAYAQLRFA